MVVSKDILNEEGISSAVVVVDAMIRNPIFWSASVMVTIVGLLLVWDNCVEYAREKTPKAIIPVIESMLIEMGSLGFIGIVISVLLNRIALGNAVAAISEEFLGEREIILETFEFLHQAFFQVAILFFVATGVMVVRVLQNLCEITLITEAYLGDDPSTCDEELVEEKLAGILKVYLLPAKCKDLFHDDDQSLVREEVCAMCDYEATLLARQAMRPPFIKELTMTMEERGAECLTIRERLIRELNLPRTFRIDRYLEGIFAANKMEVVDLSPLSWLPLIPLLSLTNALDLMHDVINSESPNATETSGYFFSTLWVLLPSLGVQLLCLAWGMLNFWKMAEIKSMLMPTLVRDAGNDCEVRLLPPAVENPRLRDEFDSTPDFLKPLERLVRKEPTNINAQLFGEVGGNGPEVYLASIKQHTWLCVTSLFFISSQILERDIYAIWHRDTVPVGDPEHLIPELLIYGAMIALNAWQLYIAPTTFLNYCLVTSVEELKMESAIANAIEGWDGTPIPRGTLKSLLPPSPAAVVSTE
jgi:hypothetical protein